MTADPIEVRDDPVAALDPDARAAFSAVAGHLIPAAHGMPSAADVGASVAGMPPSTSLGAPVGCPVTRAPAG